MQIPENKECVLLPGTDRGGKGCERLRVKKRRLRRVSELDQILCVLQRVSGSPVKLG